MAPLQAEVASLRSRGNPCDSSWYTVAAGRAASGDTIAASIASKPSPAQLRNARRAKQRHERRGDAGETTCSSVRPVECENLLSSFSEIPPSLPEAKVGEHFSCQASCSGETADASCAASETSSSDCSCGATQIALSFEDVSAPNKCIARCRQAWHGEQSGFSVPEGCLVNAWIDSKSEYGWIYAEEIEDTSRQGWLPELILQQALPHELCVRAVQSCSGSLLKEQMSINAGNLLLVDTRSITATGWIYAIKNETAEVGWVPASCLKTKMDE